MRSLIDISGSVRGRTAPILFLRQPEDACATLLNPKKTVASFF